MVGQELKFNTPYLNDYLKMVEETESPRLFHIWQAIFNMACALGRRTWLPFGPMNIYPNHYILLVGTPGTRKSTAASLGKKVLKSSTGVRFAPQDTAGHRQGLVIAMQGDGDKTKEFLNNTQLGAADNSLMSLSEINEITNDPDTEEAKFISEADKHHIAVVATEFSRFIGQNNIQMLDFLTTMWDGDDYEYQTKTGRTTLNNPLINLVGCTTPTSIASSLPPAAGGQGFLSRMILVYGARKYKQVPRPAAPTLEILDRVRERLDYAYYNIAGPFKETDDARAFSETLYSWPLEISDSRFGYYNERRYTHLIKLAMVLAAARGDATISIGDYEEAHRILRATERGMPDALGEFGMNPLAVLKQEMLEALRTAQGPVTLDELVSLFHRDARSHEISEVLNDLKRMNQVKMLQTKSGVLSITAVFTKENTEEAIMSMLAQK